MSDPTTTDRTPISPSDSTERSLPKNSRLRSVLGMIGLSLAAVAVALIVVERRRRAEVPSSNAADRPSMSSLSPNNESPPIAKVDNGEGSLDRAPKAIAPAARERERPEHADAPGILRNSIGMEFARVPAGEFLMGSNEPIETLNADFDTTYDHYDDEYPVRKVTLSRAFFLGVHEVTQEQFESIAGINPSYFSSEGRGRNRVAGMETGRLPVEMVSWSDASEFCRLLSAKPLERANRRIYRLPTEAEWEYACRAGSKGRFPFLDASDLESHAWTSVNSDDGPHEVGQRQPNAFGLRDMCGNVREWCLDYYALYPAGPATDPTGPSRVKHDRHVTRGGSWEDDPHRGRFRAADRSHDRTDSRVPSQGFRVVLEILPES